MRYTVDGLAICVTLLAFLWAIDVPYYLGVAVFTEQFIALAMALGLTLAFLCFGTNGQPRGTLPWYDGFAAGLGLACGLYITIRYPRLVDELAQPPFHNIVIGTVLLVLLIEGLRRTAGPILAAVLVVFLSYAFFGNLVPGALAGRDITFSRVIVYVTMEEGIVAQPLIIASTIVVAFIFFGQMLFATGGSAFFTDLAAAMMGRYRGGSAKIAIAASALFGSISGSAVSNVVSTGVITIPLMIEGGYRRRVAAAIEAVASTGGQIMPPVMGAAAFLMAEYLGIAYGEIVLAALLPSILYFVALFVQADLEAGRLGIGRIDESLIPRTRTVLARGWFFPIPFAVLIVGLFWLNQEPDLAAFYAAGILIAANFIFGYRGRRIGFRDVVDACRSTGVIVIEMIMITSAAGVIMGILNLTGLGFGIPLALLGLGITDILPLAILSAVICIVLGMGLPTLAVYILLAGLVAPALLEAGVDPIAAHLFVIYFGVMSMVTPPIAIAAFAAATLAKSPPLATGFAAMRFGWPAYIIPFLFIFAPSLLLNGGVFEVILTALTAIGGVIFVCVGTIGYHVRPVGGLARTLFVVAGLSLLLPSSVFPQAAIINLGGLALGLLLGGRALVVGRRNLVGR